MSIYENNLNYMDMINDIQEEGKKISKANLLMGTALHGGRMIYDMAYKPNMPDIPVSETPGITANTISVEAPRGAFRRQEKNIAGQSAGIMRTLRETGRADIAPSVISKTNKAYGDIAAAESAAITDARNKTETFNAQARNQAEIQNANLAQRERERTGNIIMETSRMLAESEANRQASLWQSAMGLSDTFGKYSQNLLDLETLPLMAKNQLANNNNPYDYYGGDKLGYETDKKNNSSQQNQNNNQQNQEQKAPVTEEEAKSIFGTISNAALSIPQALNITEDTERYLPEAIENIGKPHMVNPDGTINTGRGIENRDIDLIDPVSPGEISPITGRSIQEDSGGVKESKGLKPSSLPERSDRFLTDHEKRMRILEEEEEKQKKTGKIIRSINQSINF